MPENNDIDLGFGELEDDSSIEQELDNFAEETDSELGTTGEEDLFEKDLGYEVDEPKKTDAPSGEEVEEADDNKDGENTDQDDEPDNNEVDEDDDPDKEGDSDEDGTPIYDSKRDFPNDKLAQTVYKDRVMLNNGAAAKLSYARDLVKQLNESGSGLGAISLPELFEGNEEFVNEPFDRQAFADIDDDQAKKSIYELDKFIFDTKSKLERVTEEVNAEKAQAQTKEQHDALLQTLVDDIKLLGIDVNEASQMTFDQLTQKANSIVEGFQGEDGETYIAEHSAAKFYQRMKEIESATKRIQEFPEKSKALEQAPAKSTNKPTQVDPKAVKSAYNEARLDRADHPVFATKETEKAFIEYAENQVFKGNAEQPTTPRKWMELANKYHAMIQEEYKRYKSKPSASASKPAVEKPKQKVTPPVDKIIPERTAPSQENELNILEIDSELEALENELNRK